MKLYSRGQVALFSVASVAAVVLLLAAFGLLRFPSFRQGSAASPVRAKPVAAQGGPALDLRQSPRSMTDATVIDSVAPYTEDEKQNISVYDRLNEGVVNITTETVAVNWFLEPVPQEGGSGSGSIIDTRGYVLTNNHVVENAYKVYINFADGSQFEGKVIGTDPENDIAVVKFDPPKGKQLVTVPFGESSNLRVGQKVLAIGNPFALERTLTTGIVSGLGRPVQINQNNVIKDMIQTDASINPGNSGGPLLDSRGLMIGINAMIYSPSGGSVGIGFAIPVNTAKRVVADLIAYGRVKRGWIDITPVQLFPALVEYAKMPISKGILVSRTVKGGNAEKAGIRQGTEAVRYQNSVIYLGGDVIVGIDDQAVNSLSDLYGALENRKPNEKVTVTFFRGGKKMQTNVTLSDRKASVNDTAASADSTD
jgi:S1-C subfamily serine protease